MNDFKNLRNMKLAIIAAQISVSNANSMPTQADFQNNLLKM